MLNKCRDYLIHCLGGYSHSDIGLFKKECIFYVEKYFSDKTSPIVILSNQKEDIETDGNVYVFGGDMEIGSIKCGVFNMAPWCSAASVGEAMIFGEEYKNIKLFYNREGSKVAGKEKQESTN